MVTKFHHFFDKSQTLPYNMINFKSVQAVTPAVCISLLLLYPHIRLYLPRNCIFFRIIYKIIMYKFRTFVLRTCTTHPVRLIPLDLIFLIQFFEHYEVFQYVIVSSSSYVLSLIPRHFPQHSIHSDNLHSSQETGYYVPFPYITRDKVKIPLLYLLIYS